MEASLVRHNCIVVYSFRSFAVSAILINKEVSFHEMLRYHLVVKLISSILAFRHAG